MQDLTKHQAGAAFAVSQDCRFSKLPNLLLQRFVVVLFWAFFFPSDLFSLCTLIMTH